MSGWALFWVLTTLPMMIFWGMLVAVGASDMNETASPEVMNMWQSIYDGVGGPFGAALITFVVHAVMAGLSQGRHNRRKRHDAAV